MPIQRKLQILGLINMNSGFVLYVLIFSILLIMHTGCTKPMGQHLCAAGECFGQDIWQQSIDRIVAYNFPEERFYGKVYSDRLNNAWTTHDQNVNISEDLLSRLATMGETYVLSVSAHEIAHIQSHHYARKASLAYVSSLGSHSDDPFSYRGKRQRAMALLSRKQEMEADMLAVQYMGKAGYRPEDYLNFLKWMERNLKDSTQSEMATHPPINERISRIEKLISVTKTGRPGLQ